MMSTLVLVMKKTRRIPYMVLRLVSLARLIAMKNYYFIRFLKTAEVNFLPI